MQKPKSMLVLAPGDLVVADKRPKVVSPVPWSDLGLDASFDWVSSVTGRIGFVNVNKISRLG